MVYMATNHLVSKRVKLFCMQKDEEDILIQWINYHAYLFGLDNLHIIDNNSTDHSLQILQAYEKQGLHLYNRPDYGQKGDYLCQLIKEEVNQCDIAIPLDIDEFIAFLDIDQLPMRDQLVHQGLAFDYSYYLRAHPEIQKDGKLNQKEALNHFLTHGSIQGYNSCPPEKIKNFNQIDCARFIQQHQITIVKNRPELTISCQRERLHQIIDQLPSYGRYAFLYYLTCRNQALVYKDPIAEITSFDVIDYENFENRGNYNKKFFEPNKLINLDHGHHYGKVEGLTQNQCRITPLVLIHYHHRGVRKLVQKCKNDILGFGFVKNIDDLYELRDKIKQNVPGSHNIQTYLNYLSSGPNNLINSDDSKGVTITTLAEKLKELNSTHI